MSAVHLTLRDGVAELRLDNPAKLNALTVEMLAAIDRHCDTVEGDGSVRALVLGAEGTRAFCTGADIGEWAALPPVDFVRNWVRRGHRAFDRLARLPVPTVAAIGGPAFGGGLELAACCDIRVLSPGATLALPEASVGIVPGWSGTQRLLRLLPEAAVKEMALFGRRLSADRALALGFAAQVADDPLAAAREIAAAAAELSPRAAETAKYMIHAAAGEDRAAMTEALGSGMMAASGDRSEGIAAFRDKRKARFAGS